MNMDEAQCVIVLIIRGVRGVLRVPKLVICQPPVSIRINHPQLGDPALQGTKDLVAYKPRSFQFWSILTNIVFIQSP